MKVLSFLLIAGLAATAGADTPTERREFLKQMKNWLFPGYRNRDGAMTDGIVIQIGEVVVWEGYANGYGRRSPHLAWSASKSFSNAVAGAAAKEGLLAVSDSLCKFFPEIKSAPHCAITVDDLMRFTSGLQWKETYENESPIFSSVLAMLYGQGAGDMASFAFGHPVTKVTGKSWDYSSGDTNVLMAVVKRAVGEARYADFPWTALFDPIGAKSVTWERDGSGTFVGSSYVRATPRDLAKFGRLMLKDGVWRGKRLLPEGWVKASLTPTETLVQNPAQGGGYVSGAGWWLNLPLGKQPKPWSYFPEDTFAALGHWGQYIFVIPSWNMVIVRTGNDRAPARFDANQFSRLVKEAFHGRS